MANRKQNKANKKKKDSKIIDQKSPENAKQLMSGREAQQDNKVGSEEDEKCGFVERFMSRFGYVKKNAVMTYLIGINKQLDNNMDEDNFAKMPLKDQFAVVENQIHALMNSPQPKEDNLKDKNEEATVLVSEQTNTAEADKKDEKTDTEVVDEVTGNNVVTPVGISESDEIAKTEEDTGTPSKKDPELEELKVKNNELSETLKKFENYKSVIDDKLIGKQTSFDSLEDDIKEFNDIKSQVQKLGQEVDKLTGTNKKLEETIQKLEYTNKNSKTEYDELKASKDNLTSLLKEKEEKITELNTKLNNAETARKSAEEAKAKVDGELNVLNEKLNKANGDIEDKKKELEGCKAKCEKLEKSEVGELSKEIDTLNNEKQNADAEINRLTEQGKTNNATIEQQKQEIANLNESIKKNEGELAAEKGEVENFKKIVEGKDAEINRLAEQGKTDNATIEQQKQEIANLNESIKKKEGELAAEKGEVENYKKIVEGKDAEINRLTEKGKTDNATIEQQKIELCSKQSTIDEKVNEINLLNTNNIELRGQIKALKNNVAGLEQDKMNLTNAKNEAERLMKEKADFIKAERDAYAKSMMTLADSLVLASSKEFLGSCDEAFDDNRVSLQEKVLKPIKAFVRELQAIVPEECKSQKALEERYYAVVKEQLDSISGLTRIAQWYAYSCVPFMVDEDRSDGLFVRHTEIKEMYSLATKLLGMVGMEYRLPVLYAERMTEGNRYDDVTGRRQLNIEYMCPTARSHKEHIDCIDNSSVIIDVVEVGYRDNRGNNKNPQVII